MSSQGSLLVHFHLAHCLRSLYYIVGLYNVDLSLPSSALQCHKVGGNIRYVKKQLRPSAWYTCVYKGNEVCPILTEEQIKSPFEGC